MFTRIAKSKPFINCSIDEETGVMLVNIGKKPLTSEDFDFLLEVISGYFEKYGQFKGIIINAKKFPYWKGAHNRVEYIGFAANNHHKFEKIALAIDGFFVRLLPKIARRKIDTEVKHFGYNQIEKADQWILE